jgi:hypothetical protein
MLCLTVSFFSSVRVFRDIRVVFVNPRKSAVNCLTNRGALRLAAVT